MCVWGGWGGCGLGGFLFCFVVLSSLVLFCVEAVWGSCWSVAGVALCVWGGWVGCGWGGCLFCLVVLSSLVLFWVVCCLFSFRLVGLACLCCCCLCSVFFHRLPCRPPPPARAPPPPPVIWAPPRRVTRVGGWDHEGSPLAAPKTGAAGVHGWRQPRPKPRPPHVGAAAKCGAC